MRTNLSALARILPAATAAALFLSACGESIERNPLFKEQQKTVAQLDVETKEMGRQFEDFALTVSTLKQQFREMRNAPGGGALPPDVEALLKDLQASLKENQARLAALESKLDRIESSGPSIASATSAVSTSGSASSKAKVSPKPAPEQDEVVSEDGGLVSEDRAEVAPAPAEPKTQVRVTRTSAPKPAAPPKPAGSYYQVKDGDTAESVAAAHGVSVAALMQANGIPAGKTSRLFPGQRIFVPSK